ncbi:GlsB/YeaQ/YmgE family stress response membrane protein [Sphingomonas immobilis]|uniref:GlsB/YeaQ/YmgE family stress response membrane protein n=1 Tax=Sphingomonas immobilis TaxID=3063997 RepID=A0ABT8ZZU7_9SPHN|nr:GlsB/YeaQ/YmgE family stress response membrane protein [Sphingomonas sp. CA1-15]MDO7843106.1 GlsB/YeaQ/YmgE family stress response membrane protein [Sphingomonas sp. CA1-15]
MDRSIIGWLLIGLVAGVLAKILLPGRDPGGIVVTILVGMAGAFLAGLVAHALGWTLVGGWKNYAAATAGAVALLALYRVITNRRTR